MHFKIDFKYYIKRLTLKIKLIPIFTAEKERFIFKHLQNSQIIRWIRLTLQPAHDASRKTHDVSFAYVYIYVCEDRQTSASDGCCLVNPLKGDGRYDFFFFFGYKSRINEVLQSCTKPIISTSGSQILCYQIAQCLC